MFFFSIVLSSFSQQFVNIHVTLPTNWLPREAQATAKLKFFVSWRLSLQKGRSFFFFNTKRSQIPRELYPRTDKQKWKCYLNIQCDGKGREIRENMLRKIVIERENFKAQNSLHGKIIKQCSLKIEKVLNSQEEASGREHS